MQIDKTFNGTAYFTSSNMVILYLNEMVFVLTTATFIAFSCSILNK